MLIGGCLLILAVAWLVKARSTSTQVVVLVLLASAALAGMRAWQFTGSPVADMAREGKPATAVIQLAGPAQERQRAGRNWVVAKALALRVESGESTAEVRLPVLLVASQEPGEALLAAEPGAQHRVVGVLEPAAADQPLAAVFRIRQVSSELAAPGVWDRMVNSIHAGLRAAIAYCPPEQAALVPSFVVGDRGLVTEELSQVFQDTALTHLMAVSGSNLTLMLAVLLGLAKAIGVRGWWIRGLAVLGVAGFVVVCRQEPSVLRAAAMGLVALSALGLSQSRRSLRNLMLAVLILIPLDPYLSRSWGFALSVAACLGITFWSDPWSRALACWAPRWLATAVSVPLAAQIATMPLVVAMSGQLSVVGVFANALVGPFVGPAMVLGLLAALTLAVPQLSVAAAWCAGWAVQPILWIAHLGAAAPRATVTFLPGLAGALTGLALAGLAVVVLGWVLRRRLAALGLGLVLVLVSWLRLAPVGWPGQWQVIFCDVGQGDATVLRVAEHTAVLVDAGPEPRATLACLESAGITDLAALVLTHYHADHVGGAESVISRYRPPLVLVSPLASPPGAAREVAAAASRAGSHMMVAEPGQRVTVGQLQLRVVSAWQPSSVSEQGEGESATENDASIVLLAELGQLRILLPGDVEPEGQQRALAQAQRLGLGLEVQVLKIAHHGSARQEPRFFQATSAQMAVVSAGRGNPHGHPARKTLDLAAAFGMQVIRTDEQGSLALELRQGQLEVRSWHDW